MYLKYWKLCFSLYKGLSLWQSLYPKFIVLPIRRDLWYQIISFLISYNFNKILSRLIKTKKVENISGIQDAQYIFFNLIIFCYFLYKLNHFTCPRKMNQMNLIFPPNLEFIVNILALSLGPSLSEWWCLILAKVWWHAWSQMKFSVLLGNLSC